MEVQQNLKYLLTKVKDARKADARYVSVYAPFSTVACRINVYILPTFPGSCSKFMNGVDSILSGLGKNRQMFVPVATKD